MAKPEPNSHDTAQIMTLGSQAMTATVVSMREPVCMPESS